MYIIVPSALHDIIILHALNGMHGTVHYALHCTSWTAWHVQNLISCTALYFLLCVSCTSLYLLPFKPYTSLYFMHCMACTELYAVYITVRLAIYATHIIILHHCIACTDYTMQTNVPHVLCMTCTAWHVQHGMHRRLCHAHHCTSYAV